ncbi:MAG: DUF3616 domain-containing protein [Polyangiaceae bacterium]
MTSGGAASGGAATGGAASGGAASGGVAGSGSASGGAAAGSNSGGAAASSSGGTSGSSAGGQAGVGGAASGGSVASGGAVALDPTPGSYKQACDGSLSVAIDGTYFLDGDDDDQKLRLYLRGTGRDPVKTIDISKGIGLDTDAEADLEDAARVGNRIYVVSSHGRDKDGKLDRARFRFFGLDLAGTSPNITLTAAGYSSKLLDDLLLAKNWLTPATAVITTLTNSSKLSTDTDEDLAPNAGGTNIEALTWAPTTARPNQLLIGFRNPLQGTDAIVVSLLNADEVLAGSAARFGEAALLNLGGLGLRSMTWSPLHGAVLLLAGPHNDASGPFRLYKWSGVASEVPQLVTTLSGVPSDSSPESVVTYPNSRDVQIVFDQGDHVIGDDSCKDADSSDRLFSDAIVHVP